MNEKLGAYHFGLVQIKKSRKKRLFSEKVGQIYGNITFDLLENRHNQGAQPQKPLGAT